MHLLFPAGGKERLRLHGQARSYSKPRAGGQQQHAARVNNREGTFWRCQVSLYLRIQTAQRHSPSSLFSFLINSNNGGYQWCIYRSRPTHPPKPNSLFSVRPSKAVWVWLVDKSYTCRMRFRLFDLSEPLNHCGVRHVCLLVGEIGGIEKQKTAMSAMSGGGGL